MFSNCIDRFGHQKSEAKQQEANKEKPRKKNKIKNRNNSTYHEPLSEE